MKPWIQTTVPPKNPRSTVNILQCWMVHAPYPFPGHVALPHSSLLFSKYWRQYLESFPFYWFQREILICVYISIKYEETHKKNGHVFLAASPMYSFMLCVWLQKIHWVYPGLTLFTSASLYCLLMGSFTSYYLLSSSCLIRAIPFLLLYYAIFFFLLFPFSFHCPSLFLIFTAHCASHSM
jgi:hypothetical protein